MTSLLKLSISNYRSFYSEQFLDFGNPANHVSAIFGSNASGKSNTARALNTIKNCIINSSSANWSLPYEPFMLLVGSDKEPTTFSMTFESRGDVYSYSFSYNAVKILEEQLSRKSPNTEKKRLIFRRSEDGSLNASAAKEGFGKTLMARTRPDTLLITKAQEDNNPYAVAIFEFIHNLVVIPGDDAPGIHQMFLDKLKKDPELEQKTIQLLKRCDFSIRDFQIVPTPIPEDVLNSFPFDDDFKNSLRGATSNTLRTVHAVRDYERTVTGTVEFDFVGQESLGAQKFLSLAIPIVDAMLYGRTVYIDEFGAYLHNTLAAALIKIFKEESAGTGAELILNTHNSSILNELERQEVFLVEKGLGEESYITCLAERGARKNEAFEKRYRDGLYGAVPFIQY